ncbi:MAG: hypothetical protein SPH20_00675, partial [Eubacterium sp.]|nr:hypothetical protein [Eubacterium sp.]
SGVGDLVSKITSLYDWIYEERQGVTVVNDFALMIAKKAGINATGLPAHSMRILRIPAFTREVFGVWYLILKNLT